MTTLESNELPALPDGWEWTTIGKIADTTHNRVKPQEFPELKYIGMEHVEANTMQLVGHAWAHEMKSSSEYVNPGDVMYGRLRPYLNKVYQPDFSALCSAEFIVFRKQNNLHSSYLQYFLNSWDFVRFATNLNAGDRPRVKFEQIASYPFPLAPLEEQRRIVAAIEVQFSRLDESTAVLKRLQRQSQRYRAALLKHACEGQLLPQDPTDESADQLLQRILHERRQRWEAANAPTRPSNDTWKQKYVEPQGPNTADLPELPSGWVWVTWQQVGISQNGRAFPSKEYQETGFKLLRPGNLHKDGKLEWTINNTRHMPNEWAKKYPDYIVYGNELIINLTAQSLKDEFLGRVCITEEGEKCLLNQRLARINPILILKKYALWVFKSQIFRQFVSSLNTGSLIQHMFTSQLEEFVFPLPPLAEQERIVSEVERRLSLLDALDHTLATTLQRANRLRQAILQRAFTGQLVPQHNIREGT